MKLWLISQDVNTDYDTFDAAVVAAETEDKARAIHPRASVAALGIPDWRADDFYGWAAAKDVKVIYLGEAESDTVAGVILASFNAG